MKSLDQYRQGERSPDEEPDAEAESSEPNLGHAPELPALFGSRELSSTVRTTNPLIVRKQQLSMYGKIMETYSSAMDRVREAVRVVEIHSGSSTLDENDDNLPVLHRGLGGLTKVEEDPLEAYRVSQGLDAVRKQLFEELGELVDPDFGLSVLMEHVLQHLRKPCLTMKQANDLFPHLTLTEVSFFGLLEHVPTTFTNYGTTYDPHTMQGGEGIKINDPQRRVPSQFIGRPHGMTYVLDDFSTATDDEGISSSDGFRVLGMTDASDAVETVLFDPETATKIYRLIPLLVSNNRLYERIWKESGESLQVGLGQIAQIALERITGDSAVPEDLRTTIEHLTHEQRQTLTKERARLEQLVVRSVIKDEARNVILRPDEVIRLIGILERAPACLMEERPFKGFIQPNGITVGFFDMQGQRVEECALSPVHARELVQSMDAESQDSNRENPTVIQIFEELTIAAQTKIMTRAKTGMLELSRIEQAGMGAWENSEVQFQVLPTPVLQRVRTYAQMFRNVVTAKDVTLDLSLKAGADEAELYEKVLSLLPTSLLKHVEVLRKRRETKSLASYTRNMMTAGTYTPKKRMVTVHEPSEYCFASITQIAQADRIFTILHECGEALWANMENEQQARWTAISWSGKGKVMPEKHFLTKYSSEAPNEDFSEHFAAYVCTAEDFRTLAKKSRPLKQKYNLLREFLSNEAGGVQEFNAILPWTLVELQAGWNEQIKQRSMQDALELREIEILREEYDAREDIDEVRQSFEQLMEDDSHAEEIEESEIEDPAERQLMVIMQPEGASGSINPYDPEAKNLRNIESQVADCLSEVEWNSKDVCDAITAQLIIKMPWKNMVKNLRKLLKRFCDDQEEINTVIENLKEVDTNPDKISISIQGLIDQVNATKKILEVEERDNPGTK